MSYRVLSGNDLNYASSKNSGTYSEMLESTLDNMETDGYVLVQIEQATEGTAASFIFHRPKP